MPSSTDARGGAAADDAAADDDDRVSSLASASLDPKKLDDVARAISALTPEQAAHFAALVRRIEKRHRIQLAGYVLALVLLVVGMVLSLVYAGSQPEGTFVGWVYLVPMGLVGLVFYAFGRWARNVR